MDRALLDLSSKMTEPFCSAFHLARFRLQASLDPQKFENCRSRTAEVGVRILIVLGALLLASLIYIAPIPLLATVLFLGIATKVLRAAGFALQKGGFTHVRGDAPEKILDFLHPSIKVASFNACGPGGGMSLDHGGVNPWRDRLERIVQEIKADDRDVWVIQEVYDTAFAEAIIQRLRLEYAHFYLHMGPNVWGSVGGLMVLSKLGEHHFSHTSFENNHWTLNRGFAHLEVKANPKDTHPCLRIIGTHLIHGLSPEDKKKRFIQVAQMVNHVGKQKLVLPTIIAGDLNIERDGNEGDILSSRFRHGYLGREPTCTERLLAQWDLKTRKVWDETIDYISLFKKNQPDGITLPVREENVRFENCRLIKSFDDTYNTKTALSDHNIVELTVVV